MSAKHACLILLLPLACSTPTIRAGDEAVGLDGHTLDGARVKIGPTEGRVTLLNFWASWCAPCLDEIPILLELERELRDEGLVVFFINRGEKRTQIRRFLKATELELPNLIRDDGQIAFAYGITSLPASIVIDASGRHCGISVGARPETLAELRREVSELLSGRPCSASPPNKPRQLTDYSDPRLDGVVSGQEPRCHSRTFRRTGS